MRTDKHVLSDHKSSGNYISGIDGLRAVAVLAVIAYHLQLPVAKGGLLGVTIFFVKFCKKSTDFSFISDCPVDPNDRFGEQNVSMQVKTTQLTPKSK